MLNLCRKSNRSYFGHADCAEYPTVIPSDTQYGASHFQLYIFTMDALQLSRDCFLNSVAEDCSRRLPRLLKRVRCGSEFTCIYRNVHAQFEP
jgi:hypothetical protein